jgi:hypothetical protein
MHSKEEFAPFFPMRQFTLFNLPMAAMAHAKLWSM